MTNLILTYSDSLERSCEALSITAPNCLIKNCNIVRTKGRTVGGIYANSDATGTIIDNCNFTQNQGVEWSDASAIKLEGSNSKITNCNFIENDEVMVLFM